jgi:hypothetical protein
VTGTGSQPELGRRTFLGMAAAAAAAAVVAGAAGTAGASSATAAPFGAGTAGCVLPRGPLARYLIDELFYFVPKGQFATAADASDDTKQHPRPSGWVIDDAAGWTRQGYNNAYALHDGSAHLPISLTRPIQPQSSGRIDTEFRIKRTTTASIDGAAFAWRAGSTVLLSVAVAGADLVAVPATGSSTTLGPIGSAEVGVSVHLDLDARTASVALNGTTVASGIALPAGALDAFAISTSATGTPTDFQFGPLVMYRDMVLNQAFVASVPGAAPAAWTAGVQNATAGIVELASGAWADRFSLELVSSATADGAIAFPGDPSSGCTTSAPIEVAEFKVLPHTATGNVLTSFALANGSQVQVTLGGGSLKVIDTGGVTRATVPVSSAIWSHLKFKLDLRTSTLTFRLNGRQVFAGVVLGGHASLANPVTQVQVHAAKGSTIELDDIRMYAESPLPADYVPTPAPASTGATIIGVQTFDGWREGSHLGWDSIARYPERKPVLGWYDDGIPEVADWENLWMAEAGISFRFPCWFRPNGAGNAIRRPELSASLHEGYLESEHSAAVKYAIMWENVSSPAATSADFRQNIVPYWIDYYFRDPRYMTIDDKVVIGILNLNTFVSQLGGVPAAQAEIAYLRAQVQALGFADVIVLTAFRYYGGPTDIGDAQYFYSSDGFVSEQESTIAAEDSFSQGMDTLATISMGWDAIPWSDAIPRSFNGVAFSGGSGTGGRVLSASEYQDMATWVRDHWMPSRAATQLSRRLVMLDNWNEYGEGHFILPTGVAGFGYLDALRTVFGTGAASHAAPNAAQRARTQKLRPLDRTVPAELPSAPATSSSFPTAWDWSTDGDAQGWTSANLGTVTVSGSALRGISTANDPQVLSPTGLGIEAADTPFVRITGATDPIVRAELWFTTTTSPDFTADKCIRFNVTPAPGAPFATFDVPVWRLKTWRGTIDRVRIDPITGGGDFALDYVGLMRVPMAGPRLRNAGILEPRHRPEIAGGTVFVSLAHLLVPRNLPVGVRADGVTTDAAANGHDVTVAIGATSAMVDGAAVALAAAARTMADGSLGVPSSFLSSLGLTAGWDGAQQLLTVA